jgi:non-ribosomal peptide synthetase component F
MADATLDSVAAEISPVRADLGMIVARAAERFGPKAALVAGGPTLTYQELDDLCGRVAGGLHELGVRPGDRVAVLAEPVGVGGRLSCRAASR